MPIAFNNIPGNIRVPLFYAEVDNSQAGVFQDNLRLLLIGQIAPINPAYPSPLATPDEPVLVQRGQEDTLFGAGSILSRMVQVAYQNHPFGEIWALPVNDHTSGVQAEGDITVAIAPVASNGVIYLYIGGQRVVVGVSTTDTDGIIASNIASAITSNPNLPVEAVYGGTNSVTLLAKNFGTLGNEIDIRLDYYEDEISVGASGITINPMGSITAGAADPDITTALANLSDEPFDWIVSPYTDSVNLNALGDELNDLNGRWSPMRQLYGHAFSAKNDTLGGLSAFGNGRNDQHVSIIGYYNSPTPPWEWASAFGATAAKHLSDPPELSRPLQTLELFGVKAPSIIDRFDVNELNTLYYDGIASYDVRRDGTVQINRAVTTYQLNPYGQPDPSYLDTNTLAQIQYFLRYLRQRITQVYGRVALLDDDSPVVETGFARVRDIENTVIAVYSELVLLGVVENAEKFEELLVVERNPVDPNRVDILVSPDMVNQLRVVAVMAQFYLQYPNSV